MPSHPLCHLHALHLSTFCDLAWWEHKPSLHCPHTCPCTLTPFVPLYPHPLQPVCICALTPKHPLTSLTPLIPLVPLHPCALTPLAPLQPSHLLHSCAFTPHVPLACLTSLCPHNPCTLTLMPCVPPPLVPLHPCARAPLMPLCPCTPCALVPLAPLKVVSTFCDLGCRGHKNVVYTVLAPPTPALGSLHPLHLLSPLSPTLTPFARGTRVQGCKVV